MRYESRRVARQACAVVMLLLTACSNDSVTEPVTANTLVLVRASTASPSGIAGRPVAQPPVVRVTDGRGDPVSGVVVVFGMSGGGQVAAGNVHTSADGHASVGWWILGPKAGVQSITARVVGLDPVVFESDARAGPVATVFPEGDEQAALPGNPVSSNLSVKLIDQYDNPVSGMAVTFTVVSGGGTIANGSTVTDANGVAKSGPWTLGSNVGPQHVYMDFTPYPRGWFPVIFTAHACARLTESRCETGAPPVCASPADCGEIVFTSARDGNSEIYSVNRDGSRLTRLTTNPATDESPAWSPDGRRIAFISNRTGMRDLYLMNADGTNVVRIPFRVSWLGAPTWSPDGSEIALTVNSSEDNSIIAVSSDVATAQETARLVASGSAPWGFKSEPAWSPDGKRIAMTHTPDDESSYIATVNADGSDFKLITTGSLAFNNAAWSPDGTKLAVNFFAGTVQVGFIDANNSLIPVTRVESFGKVSWSPDGKLLAFNSGTTGSRSISWVKIDGSETAVITDNGWDPDWRR